MKNYINDYISGEKFIKINDLAYCHNTNNFNLFENTLTFKNIENISYEDKFIIYTHTDWTEELFKILNKILDDKQIIVITHNSDHEFNEELWNKKPENVVKIYSQNINYNHENLISIPIGLENLRWHPHKIPIMINKLKEVKKHRNLLYVNHSIRTYPKEREAPYQIFKNKSWCTLEYGNNGQNFNQYIDNIYNHKFICSPRGNGIDTHRMWETLYCNSIPIVIRNINNSQYSDLPIVYVNDWEEITEDFLNKKYDEINLNIQNNLYNFEKLSFEYWKNLILNN